MKNLLILLAGLVCCTALAGTQAPNIGINVSLKAKITPNILNDLNKIGRVRDVMQPIQCLTMQVRADKLSAVQSLPYVASAAPDAERQGAPVDGVAVDNFSAGLSTYNLDMINVTDKPGVERAVSETGVGVYVAVLDTGLVDSWRMYFPEERIATQFAACFGGGGGEVGTVSTQPNKWEHDQNSHGTHVTSTILGYNLLGSRINGVAPEATVIPVKVLNQNGSGWSSVIARGITYVADLKGGLLRDHPIVINMSLGGGRLDALEKAAIDYAIRKGVIVVASAGNSGTDGMGYPGAYAPVISVAAAGWVNQWNPANQDLWWLDDVAEETLSFHAANDFFIADFSSRQKEGQQLDVAAPGVNIVGPYQVNSGQLSFYYLGGTSMASPHVAGVVALMAQKKPDLTATQAEEILKNTAISFGIAPFTRMVIPVPGLNPVQIPFGSDSTGAGLVNAAAALEQLTSNR